MNIEHEYLDKLSRDLANEIDKDVFYSVTNWTVVKIPMQYLFNFDAKNVLAEWLKENVTGQYDTWSSNIAFEDPKDATMFLLRWS
jgi:hypothetical protein